MISSDVMLFGDAKYLFSQRVPPGAVYPGPSSPGELAMKQHNQDVYDQKYKWWPMFENTLVDMTTQVPRYQLTPILVTQPRIVLVPNAFSNMDFFLHVYVFRSRQCEVD